MESLRLEIFAVVPIIAFGLSLLLTDPSMAAGAANGHRRAGDPSSTRVPTVARLGLPAAYSELHRAGFKVTFGRAFSIDWSGECVPIVTRSELRSSRTVPADSSVLLFTTVPPCGVASPGQPNPRPKPSRVPFVCGQTAESRHWLGEATPPDLVGHDPALAGRARCEPLRELHDH
jgi:hypothetical protein